MSAEATETQAVGAPASLPSAMAAQPASAPDKEPIAVPKDTPGAPSANLAEGIEKMSLNPRPALAQPVSMEPTPMRREEKPEEESMVSRRNLIINYLPPNLTEGNLATLFSPYGTLEECKIVIDLETGRSRGYGFVKYLDDESAARAKTHLNGYQMDNKRLKVAYARKQCKEIQNANLYVTNIPPQYNEDQLKHLFMSFGEIIECRILRNENGQSRGVGFVRLDTHVHAMNALEQRDGHVCEDGAAPLVVKLAQRRKRNYWNTGDGRGPGPRPGGGRESASPGQSGRNPRYSNGMSGRRVGGMGGPQGFRDPPMNEYAERRRDDRDRDRRDVRGSPGFRGRGRGGYHGGFNGGQRHRGGRGGPASMRRLNYRPVQPPPVGMGALHGPPSGNMGSGRIQQPQYRQSGRGVAGPSYGRGQGLYYAPSGEKMGAASNAFPGSR